MLGLEVPLGEVTDHLVGVFRNPAILLGIPLALLGAVFMSFGAQYQYRGVNKVEKLTGTSGSAGLSGRQLMHLLRRPSWVFGTVMLGAAIFCQLAALAFAPIIIVQPIGAVSLVITTLLNARISGHQPTARSIRSIVACIAGIVIFVTIAALYATDTTPSDLQLIIILGLLLIVLIGLFFLWLVLRKRGHPLFYIAAAGVIYGFVATLAKVVISRVQVQEFDWLTLLCLIGLIVAVVLGAYFVQTAYAVGPPDLVIAGLTVIDPIVAVTIGLAILQEAANAPLWAFFGFFVAGVVAVYGVITLARYHPQIISDSQELPITRGRTTRSNKTID